MGEYKYKSVMDNFESLDNSEKQNKDIDDFIEKKLIKLYENGNATILSNEIGILAKDGYSGERLEKYIDKLFLLLKQEINVDKIAIKKFKDTINEHKIYEKKASKIALIIRVLFLLIGLIFFLIRLIL